MSFSAVKIQDEGLLQLLLDAGVQFDAAASTHYWALVKSTYTPSAAHKLYSDISGDLCTSTNYAAQLAASKTVGEAARVITFDCADVDFTNAGTDDMDAKFLALMEGDYTAPGGTDVMVLQVDLNVGVGADITLDTAIIFETTGLISLTVPAYT